MARRGSIAFLAVALLPRHSRPGQRLIKPRANENRRSPPLPCPTNRRAMYFVPTRSSIGTRNAKQFNNTLDRFRIFQEELKTAVKKDWESETKKFSFKNFILKF